MAEADRSEAALKAWATRRGGGGPQEKEKKGRREAAPGKLAPAKREKMAETVGALSKAISEGKIKGTVGEHVKTAKDFLGKHNANLEREVADIKALAPPGAKVKARTKDLESSLGKLVRKPKYGTVDKLQDGTGMRVIASDVKGVKDTVARIKEKYKVLEEDNYIEKPQEGSGYRSHHLIIQGKDGLAKEIQVRTANQNKHAEWSHRVYKPDTPAQRDAIKQAATEISKFSEAVSDHYYKVDTGRAQPSEKPKCPPVVAKHFGCP